MKLLTIAYNYPPIRGPEAIQAAHLIRELEKQNIECDVVTRFAGSGRKFSNRVEAGGNVLRTFSLDFYVTKGFMRVVGIEQSPDAEILWKPFAMKKASECLRAGGYDFLYTRSVPFTDHLIGLSLKRKFDIPWIAHFSDPWTESIYANYRSDALRKKNEAWEKTVMETADALVFTSLETLELYAAKYGEAVRIKSHVMNHTFNEDMVAKVKVAVDGESADGKSGETGNIWLAKDDAGGQPRKKVLSHVGNFYGKRTPDDIIEAVCEAKKTDPALGEKLSIDFYGNVPGMYREDIAAAGVDDVIHCCGEVPYFESQKAMRRSNFLISVDASCENNVFFPSKLVEYMAYERPIIAITSNRGTVSRVLSESGHLTVENGDTEALAQILLDISDGTLDTTGIDYSAVKNYRPQQVAKDFIEILKITKNR